MTNPTLFLINALGAGGSERQLLYLLSGLDRSRFSPVVCTVYDDAAYPPHPPYVQALHALGIPRYTLAHGTGWRGRADALRRLIALEWRLRPRVVQGFLHYANLLTRAARPFCPPHTLFTSARDEFLPGELRSESLTWWLDRQLICNAPHVRQQVLTHTPRPPARVSVIPNGLPVDIFTHNPDPELRRRHFGDQTFVVGCVGRIAEKKNLHTLIEAVARLRQPDLRLFLLGEVSDAPVQQRLDDLIAQHHLGAVVQRLPSAADVRPYYHAADVLVLPSRIEGLPNVVLEAFASGKPVIISEGANGAALVEPGVNGWQFPTADAEALAACIAEAMRLLPAQRAEFAQRARASAEPFRVEAMVAQYSDLYEFALTRK